MPAAAAAGTVRRPGRLPCLYSDNGDKRSGEGGEERLAWLLVNGPGEEGSEEAKRDWLEEVKLLASVGAAGPGGVLMTPYHRKVAFALAGNIAALAGRYGIERLGFLTLTTKTPKKWETLQRMFKSLCRRELPRLFEEWIVVVEFSGQGRLHLHLVVVLPGDIRTGFDFEGIKRHDYRSANALLRWYWKELRGVMERYQFGRHELLPIRSTADGIAKYVGSYIKKSLWKRPDGEVKKKCRLARYSSGWKAYSTRLAWNTQRAWLWRRKLARFAYKERCRSMDELRSVYGPRWAWLCRLRIVSTDPFEVMTQDQMELVASSQDLVRQYVIRKGREEIEGRALGSLPWWGFDRFRVEEQLEFGERLSPGDS